VWKIISALTGKTFFGSFFLSTISQSSPPSPPVLPVTFYRKQYAQMPVTQVIIWIPNIPEQMNSSRGSAREQSLCTSKDI
jgi:hypothetical protein